MAVTTPAPAPHVAEGPVPHRRRRRPWFSIVAVGAGVLLLAGAGLWRTVAVDSLVKFPTDVDLHPVYQGTLTAFVDPATSAPLASPSVVPLQVDRTIAGVPGESTDSRVLVRETFGISLGGGPPTEQLHQYVMDRSTSANVADQRAWAYTADNVVDRTGAYWVALPRDVSATSTVPMFKDEIGTTFPAKATGATESIDGLKLLAFEGSGTNVPVTGAYLSALAATVPLPSSLTFDQLKPALVAAGVPIDATLAALVRVASQDDLAALVQLTGQPIPLQYVDTFSGRTYVEPDTGAVVDVQDVVERISVRPAATALPPLLAVLGKYTSDPTVAQAVSSLQAIADKPLPAFEYRYSQTPASAADVARWVSDQRDQKQLAETTIPLILLVAGGVLVVAGTAGILISWRRSR